VLSVTTPVAAQFSLHPNPASDRLTFNPKANGAYTLSLYNTLGALVRTVQATGESVVNVSDLPTGVYFAHYTQNGNARENGVKKIMIAR